MTCEQHLRFDNYNEWIKITDHTLLQLAKSIDVMVTYFNEYRRKFNEKSPAASDVRSKVADRGNTKTSVSVFEELCKKVEDVKLRKDFAVSSIASVLCNAKEELNRQVLYQADSASSETAPFHNIELERYADETSTKISCLRRNDSEIHDLQDAKTQLSETNVHSDVESTQDDGNLTDQHPELKNNSVDSDAAISNTKHKTSMKVQIYSHLHESLFPEIEGELIRQLKENLEDTVAGDTEFVIRKQKDDIQSGETVFLLCLTSSRIGTDVANLLHGLKLTSEMTVIVFHHKDEYVLPSQASKRLLIDESYKCLGGIYDMAYLSSKGIYMCEMNEKSIKSLTRLILQKNTE